MNDKHTTPITTDLPPARKSSLLVRLSVLIGVLGIGVGLLWWQKANEPPAPKPSEIELAMRNAVAGWERTQRSLQEELATHRPATEAYLKQRQERLLAGQFELPLDAMSNPQLQLATANFRRRDTEVYRQHSTDAGLHETRRSRSSTSTSTNSKRPRPKRNASPRSWVAGLIRPVRAIRCSSSIT